MPVYVFLLLFLTVILVSLYDLRYQRVPNLIAVPLLLISLVSAFPGNPVLWIGSAFIFQAWRLGVIGGGDAKLWVALFWGLFAFAGERILLVMCVSLIITGLAQITLRALWKKKIETGIKMAGAWRIVVFMGLLAYFSVPS